VFNTKKYVYIHIYTHIIYFIYFIYIYIYMYVCNSNPLTILPTRAYESGVSRAEAKNPTPFRELRDDAAAVNR